MSKPMLMGTFVIVSVIGAVLVALTIDPLIESRAVQAWPTVEGTIVVSEIVGERAIRPRIVYAYTLGDSTYRSESTLDAPMFGGKRKKYDVAEELVSQYPVGSPVTVFYNPDSITQSTLAPSVEWNVYGKLGLGILLFVLGLLGLLRPGLRPIPARQGSEDPTGPTA